MQLYGSLYNTMVAAFQVAGNLVALFFPASSAAAAANLESELEIHVSEVVRALQTALDHIGDEVRLV